MSEVSVQGENFILLGLFNVGLLVLSYSLLEEVSLTGERDHVHPFEGVFDLIVLRYSEGEEKSISNEHNVLTH